ncbi:hypothetical protein [Streptomyces avicenniae]|uniref:hypothetical protein n=1 Tax=Streptomyces avicenniae TaxID=500153 RepID=UPI00069B0977|nr:hypothetical protein [Streptomyces avicenniae]
MTTAGPAGAGRGLWPDYREDYGDDVDWAEEAEEAQAEEEIGGAEESVVPTYASGRRAPRGAASLRARKTDMTADTAAISPCRRPYLGFAAA